jgi:hypothetical protein
MGCGAALVKRRNKGRRQPAYSKYCSWACWNGRAERLLALLAEVSWHIDPDKSPVMYGRVLDVLEASGRLSGDMSERVRPCLDTTGQTPPVYTGVCPGVQGAHLQILREIGAPMEMIRIAERVLA